MTWNKRYTVGKNKKKRRRTCCWTAVAVHDVSWCYRFSTGHFRRREWKLCPESESVKGTLQFLKCTPFLLIMATVSESVFLSISFHFHILLISVTVQTQWVQWMG